MKLSILIPSLKERSDILDKLLMFLRNQRKEYDCNIQVKADRDIELTAYNLYDVEILTALDNKQYSTGYKRNVLLIHAAGDYVVFLNDDTRPADYYIEELMKAAENNTDCIGLSGYDSKGIKFFISKDYQNITVQADGEQQYLKTTNHMSPVKKSIALKAYFPNSSNGETEEYTRRILPYLKTEFIIEKPLIYDVLKTERSTF